jgi:hypothetical protein
VRAPMFAGQHRACQRVCSDCIRTSSPQNRCWPLVIFEPSDGSSAGATRSPGYGGMTRLSCIAEFVLFLFTSSLDGQNVFFPANTVVGIAEGPRRPCPVGTPSAPSDLSAHLPKWRDLADCKKSLRDRHQSDLSDLSDLFKEFWVTASRAAPAVPSAGQGALGWCTPEPIGK